MADHGDALRQHLFISNFTTQHAYQRWGRDISVPAPPPLNRQLHGNRILQQIETLTETAVQEQVFKADLGFGENSGLIVEVEGRANWPLALESIENQRLGIELLNVRVVDRAGTNVSIATVFVPEGRLAHFVKVFREYLEENTTPSAEYPDGHPKNQPLAESIAGIRRAAFNALWTDPPEALPATADELAWWEVWLPVRASRATVTGRLRAIAQHLGLHVANDELHFAERTVLLMRASREQIEASIVLLDCIAELRSAKKLADFYVGLDSTLQREHIDKLLARVRLPQDDAPAVCLLDTGVNWGHPLLNTVLSEADCSTIDPNMGVADEHGHGTELAGVAMLGDLSEQLRSDDQLGLTHKLESVKLLREPGQNGDPQLYGALTADAVAYAEVANPRRNRVFNLAISAGDNFDHGRPSAWSTAIDQIAFNAGGDPRLVVVSSGNVTTSGWVDYPDSNEREHVHDPAQAWNALTVGSYTAKVQVTDRPADQYRAVANEGGLSPFSTTSTGWNSSWPFKPDVVFEGGNAVRTDMYAEPYAEIADSLFLLTASNRIPDALFATTGMTSASAALASRFAAQLLAQYPTAWPETVRALIVHSASWTDEMKRQFLNPLGHKRHFADLVQHCGFGVPSIEKAMWSAKNSLTLIIQDELQPFQRIGSNTPKAKDMHLHQLPWPKDVLEGLDADVRLRVTLSYFVEPNPRVFARGVRSRYTYESHGLRFKVKPPQPSDHVFLRQVSALAEGDRPAAAENDPGWLLGESRFRGSVHSDVWTGPAADLASRGTIAVFPMTGWWKTRLKQQRYNSSVRYSMVVSIEAPEIDVDLYTPISDQIEARIRQPVGIVTGI